MSYLIQSIQDLLVFKDGKSRVLGLDVGDKTVGLSVCDPGWLIATPLKLITRRTNQQDFEQINTCVKEYQAAALVVGLPLNMNGTEGYQAKKVRNFIDKLVSHVDIAYYFWDERLSTVAVTRTMLEADLSRKRQAQAVDKMAATFILQGVLDLCLSLSKRSD